MFAEVLEQRLGSIVRLSKLQIEQLEGHYELLVRWNRVLNLTSINNINAIIERHYCESLFLGAHLPTGSLAICDVGSGGGFPGIPVAIVRPECSVVLIESHQRKGVFLREASRQLKNVTVMATRAENVRQRFDWVLSRAVNFEKIERFLCVLAPQAALLGAKDVRSSACFTWNKTIKLPWGNLRYLSLGKCRST